MSRIILTRYNATEDHLVVGWDRPLQTFYWQEFNKEPEITQEDDGWQVSTNVGKFYDTEKEAEEHKWDDWQEMLGFAGYMRNEFPTLLEFMNKLPDKFDPVWTPRVTDLLEQHKLLDYPASNVIVDLTKGPSNVVQG